MPWWSQKARGDHDDCESRWYKQYSDNEVERTYLDHTRVLVVEVWNRLIATGSHGTRVVGLGGGFRLMRRGVDEKPRLFRCADDLYDLRINYATKMGSSDVPFLRSMNIGFLGLEVEERSHVWSGKLL